MGPQIVKKSLNLARFNEFPFLECFDEKLLLCIGDIAVKFNRVEIMSLHMLFQ